MDQPASPDTVTAGAPAATATAGDRSATGEVVGERAAVTLKVGDRIAGRYRLTGLLGRGGAGDVFAVRDELARIDVALKLVRPRASAVALERVRRELVLARRVSHPRVCRVFDLGHHDGADGPVWFITMDLLRGQPLADRLDRDGPLALAQVRTLAADVLAALTAAHAAGVVHRDLTPANIILVDGGRAVVTDFGLAIADDQAYDELARAGTPAYMAPEQVEGTAVTPATDVFALGAVLYHALAGRPPWRGPTSTDTARARLTTTAPPLATLRRDVPAAWAVAIGQCLARRPEDRPADLAALARVFAPPPRRRARVALAAAAAALLGGGAVALTQTRGGGRRPGAIPIATDGPVRMAYALEGGNLNIEGLHELPDGDVVLSGHGSGPMRFRGVAVAECTAGDTCALLARVSPRGQVRWMRALPATRAHGPAISGDAVIVTGAVRIPGQRVRSSSGAADSYVASFDLATGALRWRRDYGLREGRARAIAADGDGGAVALVDRTGWIVDVRPRATNHLYPAPELAWQLDDGAPLRESGAVVAFDRAGAVRWVWTLGALDGLRLMGVVAIGDRIFVAAYAQGRLIAPTASATDGERMVLAALDRATGAPVWVRDLPGQLHPQALAAAPDGSVVLAGWAQRFDVDGFANPGASPDLLVGRFAAADGRFAWLTSIGGVGWDQAFGAAVAGDTIWVAGRSDGLTPRGHAPTKNHAVVALAYTLDGRVRTSWTPPFAGKSAARGVAASADGGAWVVGRFEGDLRVGPFTLHADDGGDGYALRLAPPP